MCSNELQCVAFASSRNFTRGSIPREGTRCIIFLFLRKSSSVRAECACQFRLRTDKRRGPQMRTYIHTHTHTHTQTDRQFELYIYTRIHGPSFVRARYCSVKIGLWTRHVHLCCEVPDILNEFESCSSRLFR